MSIAFLHLQVGRRPSGKMGRRGMAASAAMCQPTEPATVKYFRQYRIDFAVVWSRVPSCGGRGDRSRRQRWGRRRRLGVEGDMSWLCRIVWERAGLEAGEGRRGGLVAEVVSESPDRMKLDQVFER